LSAQVSLPFPWSITAWQIHPTGYIPAELLAVCRLVLALLVSLHVLRYKRDIGAAIGWIGLAWIAPFTGGLLYILFGVNRVRRLARRMRPSRGDTPPAEAATPAGDGAESRLAALDHAGWRLTRRHRVTGNDVRILENGDAAYPAMLATLQAAKNSIALTTYILTDDQAGGPFVDALIAAHQRGVAVRVLLDGIGSGYFRAPAFGRLRRNGVPAAQFMHSPLPWRMPFLNLRTHKKILVVDGTSGFTGGMNINAANVLATHPKHPVRDIHFAITGPVVGQLLTAFVDDWQFATGETLHGAAWFPHLVPSSGMVARVVTSGPDKDLEHIEYMILQAVACARTTVEIMTPYFLPAERLVTALALAALRGVRVDVLVPQHSNHVVTDWAAGANSPPMLKAGVNIWQNPPPFDHSKLMVVDGLWCFIGSANWDTRSFRLNFEVNVEVCDAGLAGALSTIMAARRGSRVTQSTLDARGPAIKLRDAATRLLLPYL
jgi:cardiolipin synthase